ncbi:hypothetical protein EGW08_012697, partial [Elysia chlorotica]
MYPVPLIAQTCTTYIVVIITLERYVVITLPFRAHAICTFKWAVGTVGLCVVFAVLYHIPDYLAFAHFKVWNPISELYVHGIRRTEFGHGHFYKNIFSNWMNFTVNFLVPFALLLIFNSLTLFSFS